MSLQSQLELDSVGYEKSILECALARWSKNEMAINTRTIFFLMNFLDYVLIPLWCNFWIWLDIPTPSLIYTKKIIFPLNSPLLCVIWENPPISFDKNFIYSGGQQNQFWGTTAPVLVSSQCTTVQWWNFKYNIWKQVDSYLLTFCRQAKTLRKYRSQSLKVYLL